MCWLLQIALEQTRIKAGLTDVHIWARRAFESWTPDRFCLADVAFQVLVQNIFVSRIFEDIKLIWLIFVGILYTVLTNIKICYCFRFIPLRANTYLILACLAVPYYLPIKVILTKLISKRKPAFSQIVVSRKQLNFIGCWQKQIDQGVYLFWFL